MLCAFVSTLYFCERDNSNVTQHRSHCPEICLMKSEKHTKFNNKNLRRMRKTYFYTLFALSLAAGNFELATAATVADSAVVSQLYKTTLLQNGSEKLLPEAIKAFLATPVGKQFTAEQVEAVYGKTAIPQKVTTGVVSETKIDEDFSLMTAGSEDAPDATDISGTIDNYTNMPGWGSFITFQAGGKAYLGFDEVGEDGPGYLMTPVLDLSDAGGTFKITFRVKNVNPNVTDQNLQYFIINDDPDDQKKGIISANFLPMTTEWTDLELVVDDGVPYTSVMFFGWQGKVMVDNVKLEKLTYPLNKPANVSYRVTGGGEITVTWDAVDGAAEYLVELIDNDANEVVAVKTVSETKAALSLAIDTSHRYVAHVTAVNGDKTSFPANGYGNIAVNKVDAPVALDATNISTSGFTANWETSQYAANYKVSFVRTHTVGDEGEDVTYIDDDFSQIPYKMNDPKGVVQTMDYVTPVSLDDFFQTPGWSTLLGVGFTGGFAITNMYESYGLPGALFGPVSDFTVGEGKAHITGSALSSIDDVQVKVGFGSLDADNQPLFNEGAQVFDVSTKGSSFDVEVTGGSENSRLIFQIIDAAEGGDLVAFTNLKATATMKPGDRYTLPYGFVKTQYDANSYELEVPFTGDDKFEYTVTGSFGSKASAASNTITVYSPEASAINAVGVNAKSDAVYFTLDGMRVTDTSRHGVYVVKQGGKTFKVLK